MEELTDNCLKMFEKWLDGNDVAPYRSMFNTIPVIVQHSYLLAFFDENGINICPYVPNETGYWAHSLEGKAKYDSRTEAIKQALPIANEMFNQK